MSRSYFKWLIVYTDDSTQIVVSDTIDRIINIDYDKLEQSTEDIINIIRLDLA